MIEIEYKEQSVFAPNFKDLLQKIYSESNTDLLYYLLNNEPSTFSDKYRSISCGNLDYEYEEECETDKKEEIKCNFTPKGKLLYSDGGFFSKKYRMDGNIGSILKQLVEGDSSIIKCRKKTFLGTSKEFIEDIKYGFNIKDENYFLLDPAIPYTGKISNFEFKVTKFPDAMYEDLVYKIKGYLSKSYKLEIVKGSDIVKYYNESSYDTLNRGGSLWSSCMRYNNCSDYIKFYAKIPECSMLIIKKESKILGRALIWDTNFGKVLDRRYTTLPYLENVMISYAKKNKWHYKTHNTYNNIAEYTCYNYYTGEYSNKNVPLIIRISNPNIKSEATTYPYCDTFSIYHYYDNMLTNYNRSSPSYVFSLKNTGGAKSSNQINLNSLFKEHSSVSDEKTNVVKEDFSNINTDPDLYGYSCAPIVRDWEGRSRLKHLCDYIDNEYVCTYNKKSYEDFLNKKK